jgi:hypothetical protein
MARKFWRNQASLADTTPDMPSTVPELQARLARTEAQLKLCRLQNADLNRQLQRDPPTPAPVTATTELVPPVQHGPEGSASLEAENRHLQARLAQAADVFRQQEATRRQQEARGAQLAASLETAIREVERVRSERDQARAERDRARGERDWAKSQAQIWQTIADLARLETPPPPPAPAQVFKHLLVLAHPDRWSQGQLALELAHELSVTINGLRQSEGRRA